MNFKNFLRLVNYVMSNQKGSFGATDYDMSSYMEDETTSVDDQATPEEGEPLSGEQSSEPSLEEKLNSLELQEGENSESEGSYLDKINALGLIHNGLPFEVGDEEQLKELIMKGNDYTFKTQELANERKDIESQLEQQTSALEERVSAFEQEKAQHQEMIQEYNIFQNILEQVKTSYPDVYEEMQSAYSQSMAMYNNAINNPVLNEYKQKYNELEEKLNGFQNSTVEKQATGIKEEWENGLKEAQTNWGAKLKSLGIKPNWAEVQKTWQSDSSKTMTVPSALLAVYGDKITKALESKEKLIKTKTDSILRNGAQPTPANTTQDEAKPVYRQDAYEQSVNEIAKRYI